MAAFKMFDMNGDGLITKEELMQVMKTMGDKVSEKDATQMIKYFFPLCSALSQKFGTSFRFDST